MLKERFCGPIFSKSFRFLHLLPRGASAPTTSTSTTNETKSHADPPQAALAGFVVIGVNVLAVSEAALAVAGIFASAGAGGLTGAAGVAAAAGAASASGFR